MYTRCNACGTIFHITAAELRSAQGAVVCGACGVTFNALDTLSETRPADPPPARAPRMPPGGDEPVPSADEQARDEEEFLEELEALIGPETEETIEPEMLSSHGRDEPPSDTDLDYAAVTPIDDAFDDEFDDALDDAFDDALDRPIDDAPHELPGAALEDEPDEHFDDRIPDPDSVFRVDDLPGEPGADDDELVDELEERPREPGLSAMTPDDESGDTDLDDPQLGDLEGDLDPEPAEEPTPEDQRVDTADLAGLVGAVRRKRTWPKVLVGLLLSLVLGGAWVHSQHGKLLRNPAAEALLSPVYSTLGIAAAPDWDPAAFRALQWEAVAGMDRPDHLTVAVDFQNSAPFDQPFPIIRIVLEDRFGRRLGTHDVAPAEYRDHHSPAERLPAGARMRTTLMVPDPSARADGFRVDFCLEMATKGLVCGPQTFR